MSAIGLRQSAQTIHSRKYIGTSSENGAQRDVRPRRERPEPDRLVILRDGRIQFSRGIQHRAVIVVHFRAGAGQIRCPLQQFAGFFRAPLFEADDAEQMPGFGIVRFVHQYELAADVRILQPPRLEMRVRLVQRIAVHLFRIPPCGHLKSGHNLL